MEGEAWQGIGIIPDIEVEKGKAALVAQRDFVEFRLEHASEEMQRIKYRWILEGINSALSPLSENIVINSILS